MEELDPAVAAVGPEQRRLRWRARAPGRRRSRCSAPRIARDGGLAEPALEEHDERRRAPARTRCSTATPTGSGCSSAAAYATAATNKTRASANQAIEDPRYDDAPPVCKRCKTSSGASCATYHDYTPDYRGPCDLSYRSSASSASPTVRTPTSSHSPAGARSDGSMFASGMMQRRNPICAASRTRSARLRDAADLAGQPDLAEHRGRRRDRRGCARSTRSPRATPRSDAGSSTVIPPAMFTNTSSPIRFRPARFSSTASSSDSRC